MVEQKQVHNITSDYSALQWNWLYEVVGSVGGATDTLNSLVTWEVLEISYRLI